MQGSQLALVLLHAESLKGDQVQLLHLLRSWLDAARGGSNWNNLRMVATVSKSPVLIFKEIASSPFNTSAPIQLDDLTKPEVTELADRFGCSLTEADFVAASRLVGGHPRLLHVLLRNWPDVRGPISVRSPDDAFVWKLFGSILIEHLRHLESHPNQRNVFVSIARGEYGLRGDDIVGELQSRGLVRWTGGRYQTRYGLYQYLLSRLE